ncbi:flagellar hook-length control protein FliK [Salibacterium aidingense]|uniref:flagellar hook-length control protein FliK n=1 Tax=Salibacterium aidingense TaxID=384933 RepID=UPI003BC4E8BE
MQMQMLMQALPTSKISNQQWQDSLNAAADSKKGGFFDALGKALQAEMAGDASPGNGSSEVSEEELFARFFENGEQLLEEFGEELRALFADGPLEWTSELKNLLEGLPQEMQALAEMLSSAEEKERTAWIEESLTPTTANGVTEMLEALKDFLAEKGETELAEKVEAMSSEEETMASALTGLIALLNQSIQASNNEPSFSSGPFHQQSSGLFSSISSLVSSFINAGKQQDASNPQQSLQQLTRWMENQGQQHQMKSMEGLTEAWKKSSSESETKLNYLQQLLNRGMTSSESTASKAQPASLTAQDSTGVMAKAQQAVIFLGEGKTEHARAQEFMKQFQELLGKSNLQSFKNGTQQLTVKLVPENLGRLDVKIVQQNGQLTAQLMTSTNTAREMVESQIHQLRTAFHQQNIQVDRIDVAQQQASTLQEDHQEQGDQQENENGNRTEEDIAEENEESFADMLEELTFNEQV